MGGRGTFAAGNPVDNLYEVDTSFSEDGKWEGVKILKGKPGSGKHGLPESSHSSDAYLKLEPDGTFRELRLYDKSHALYLEIAYTIEESLTGNRHEKILHYHTYDSRFSQNKDGPFSRSEAKRLTDSMLQQYKKYFRGLNI